MMSELIYKQQAIDAIYNTFSYAYCNNCENNGKDNDSCDECHRKYQNWAASRDTIESVINALPSAQPENTAPKTFEEQMNLECEFCRCHECGDTLYELSDWDDYGIGFDYIRDIKYCPICGKRLFDD